jgi:hypothetical protein
MADFAVIAPHRAPIAPQPEGRVSVSTAPRPIGGAYTHAHVRFGRTAPRNPTEKGRDLDGAPQKGGSSRKTPVAMRPCRHPRIVPSIGCEKYRIECVVGPARCVTCDWR